MTAGFEQYRYDTLTSALMNKGGMPCEEAGNVAIRVLNYFGFEYDVIDNLLDQGDRRLFYFLQDIELMKTEWEEVVLPTGRTWRVFYWILNVDHIDEFAKEVETKCPVQPELYDSLPAGTWSRQEA